MHTKETLWGRGFGRGGDGLKHGLPLFPLEEGVEGLGVVGLGFRVQGVGRRVEKRVEFSCLRFYL